MVNQVSSDTIAMEYKNSCKRKRRVESEIKLETFKKLRFEESDIKRSSINSKIPRGKRAKKNITTS